MALLPEAILIKILGSFCKDIDNTILKFMLREPNKTKQQQKTNQPNKKTKKPRRTNAILSRNNTEELSYFFMSKKYYRTNY
jgi:molecular chaperone DnaK (HSP70)